MKNAIDLVVPGREAGTKARIGSPNNFVRLLLPAFVFAALLAFAQPLKADGALTLGAVNSALAGQSDAYSALLDFAQMVGADQPKIEVAAKKAAPAPKIVAKAATAKRTWSGRRSARPVMPCRRPNST